MLNVESANVSFKVFYFILTRPLLEHTIYHTRGEHVNHCKPWMRSASNLMWNITELRNDILQEWRQYPQKRHSLNTSSNMLDVSINESWLGFQTILLGQFIMHIFATTFCIFLKRLRKTTFILRVGSFTPPLVRDSSAVRLLFFDLLEPWQNRAVMECNTTFLG